MKRVIQSILSLSVIILLSACDNSQPAAENHEGHDHASHEGHDHASANATGAITVNDDKLNAVYQHYLHLTKALTDGDAAEAKVAAAAIELGASEVDGATAIASSAAKIINAASIEDQRLAYSALSNELIVQLKKSGLISGSLYVGYCPMALNDRGAYWISNKKEVKNPYFGASMLTCGEIKETI